MRVYLPLAALAIAATSCSENTPVDEPGAVVIGASTSGLDEDADGYAVLIDGRILVPIPSDGSVRIGGLDPGAHEALLQHVAPNCDASPSGTHTFQVAPRDTTQLRFFVTCHPTGVTIHAAVEGVDHGEFYTIILDGQTRPELIEPGGRLTITGLSPGTHDIRLENLPFNCALTPSHQTVQLTLRSITPVSFTSRCSAIVGALEVGVVTSGGDLDLDGYAIHVDGEPRMGLPANGGLARTDLTAGTVEVRLANVAKNCVVTDGDTRTVTISTGGQVRDTVRVSFAVQCERLWGLAFVREGSLVFATADGTIDDFGPHGFGPAWSPDGQRLAWTCGGICVADMNTGQITGWSSAFLLEAPAWSPDGNRIAYIANECEYYWYYYWTCEFKGLYVAQWAGAGAAVLLNAASVAGASYPAWSPDGSTIAFGCSLGAGGPDRICTVRVDGTSFRSVTQGGGDTHPSWSPDGTRLVYSTNQFGGREIVTIKPDGTDLDRFDPAVQGWSPSWTRDGRIVFANSFGGIAIMNADGTGLTRLTRTVLDSLPALRP